MKKFKVLLLSALLIISTLATATPVSAASKKNKGITIDPTLAVPAAFSTSQYVLLNPVTAIQCGLDMQKMYNYYMQKGVREGQRIYATATPTVTEKLFLYMSYNRSYYIANGMKSEFPYFNINNYVAKNPELLQVFNNDLNLYLYHYVNFGIYEGKSSGSITDPARVIELNPALAEYQNPKLAPEKIMANYTLVTGQPTTVALDPIFDPKNGNLNGASAASSQGKSCEHDWEWVSLDGEGKHEQRCKKCGACQNKEKHDYEVYKKTYNDDETMHTLKCKVCGHKHGEKHKDKYNVGVCDICHKEGLHVHVYVIQKTGQTKDRHVLKCSCGSAITEPHEYELVDGAETSTTHKYACECGYSKTEKHNFVDNICDICGYAHVAHVYTVWSYDASNPSHHTRTCSICKKKQTEVCSPRDEGTTCATCGHKFPDHSHVLTKWEYDTENPGHHKRSCEKCSYTEEGTCSPLDGKCSTCGHQHVHEYTKYGNVTDTSHDEICICGAKKTVNHDYKYISKDNNVHVGKCACGKTTADQAHTFEYDETKSTETHHVRKCTVCGKKVSEEHAFTTHVETKDTDTTHTYKCACNYEKTSNHTFNDPPYTSDGADTHLKECTVCNHHVHEAHDFDYDAGTGKYSCKYCPYEYTHTSHVYNIIVPYDEDASSAYHYDNTGHKLRCVCGDERAELDAHNSHESTKNYEDMTEHDTAAEFTHKSVCACGYLLNATETCTPSGYVAIPEVSNRHKATCTACGGIMSLPCESDGVDLTHCKDCHRDLQP